MCMKPVCTLCKQSFWSSSAWEKHVSRKHSNLLRVFTCSACYWIFETKEAYKNHRETCGLEPNNSPNLEKIQIEKLDSVTKMKLETCNVKFDIEHAITTDIHIKTERWPFEEIENFLKKFINEKYLLDDVLAENIRGKFKEIEDKCLESLNRSNGNTALKLESPDSKNMTSNSSKEMSISHDDEICDENENTEELPPTKTEEKTHMNEKLNELLKNNTRECTLCHKILANKHILIRHCRSFHPDELNLTVFKCEHCSFTFADERKRQKHYEKHHASGPVDCDLCGKQFGDENKLKYHKNTTHKQVQFECPKCGKSFSHGFWRHKRVCFNVRRFECEVCGKKLIDRSSLTIHMRSVHCDVRHHICEICGKTFTMLTRLNLHVRRAHLGIKRYSCDKCPRKFYQRSEVRKHMISHVDGTERERLKAYQCTECGKSFLYAGSLIKHKKIHSGIKPYTCEICSRNFGDKSHLNRHRRIHTGEKPYACAECPASFRRSENLKNHLQTHSVVK